MKKFIHNGEYFVLSVLKITNIPLVNGSCGEDANPARVICEDAFYLSAAGNGQTSVELLRIAGSFKGSEISHFLIVRTHSADESECVLRQEALVHGALTSLHQAGYVCEEITYEQLRSLQKSSNASTAWAMSKQELTEAGLHNSYRSTPILSQVDWRSIYSSLDGSGCSLSIQVIPSGLTDSEAKLILKNHLSCTQASEGMAANLRDPLVEHAKERWSYYADRVNRPLAEVNILVSGPAANTALAVARIRQSMSDIVFDSISATVCKGFTVYNQPWVIAKHIRQSSPAAGFCRYSIEEAGLLLELPRQEGYFTGVKENPFSLTPETGLLSSALTKQTTNSVLIGKSLFSNQRILLPYIQLLLHTAILGKSGVGKTTLIKQIIRQLTDGGISVLIMEPVKREYRAMTSEIKNSRIFTVERPVVPFLLNPFSVPEGVTLGEYRSSLLSAFKAAFSMPDPLPSLFEKAISEAYTLHGWTDMSQCTDASVSEFDMHDFIRIFKRIILNSTYSNEVKGNMMSGGAFRLQSLLERCPRTFDTLHSTDVSDYINGCAVLEMGTLEPEQKVLVSALTLIRVLSVLKATRDSGSELRNIILIDEVHALLDQGDGVTQEEKALNNAMSQLLINVITELRAYGVGVILSDQSPSRVGGCILDNVDNLISFRLSGTEAELLRTHMGAEDNLTACLSLAEVGEFFLKNQYLREPLGIRMNKTRELSLALNCSDRKLVLIQGDYLRSKAHIYCPYASCTAAADCSCCSVAIREEAHKYAAQIYSERQSKLGTPDAIAAHILRIPAVISQRARDIPKGSESKLYKCIAIHLLRICSLEKGITLSDEAVKKLLADMLKA